MSQERLVEMLRKDPWFGGLAPGHFDTLLGFASERYWSTGQFIFREGDHDDWLYLILEGLVAVEINVPTRGRIMILTVGPDEFLGWSSAVPVIKKKTASARATDMTYAVAFNSAALRTACEQDHDLGFEVYQRLTGVIASRLTATRMQLLDMYAVDHKG